MPLLALAGCTSESVEIETPSMSGSDAAACRELVDALPDTLLGELRRPVVPDDAPGAAWGDPPASLQCGVAEAPAGYEPGAECLEVRGVGWFIPEEDQADLTGEATATVLTHAPRVELVIPGELRSAGVDQALADVSRAVKRTLEPGEPCL